MRYTNRRSLSAPQPDTRSVCVNRTTDTERRAGLTAIAESLLRSPIYDLELPCSCSRACINSLKLTYVN